MELMSDEVDVSALLRSGVYLLYCGDKVVYVGQSKCPLVRIYTHRSLARKRVPSWLRITGITFDRATVIPCHPDRIDALERGLIAFHRPRHNITHNPSVSRSGSPLAPRPPLNVPVYTQRL